MVFSCFRPSGGNSIDYDDDRPQAARPKKTRIRRQTTSDSQASNASSISNESISRLGPCKRTSDPKIEAMMMPVSTIERPSQCLRLSHPKVYSSLVSDMKCSMKCRDWKNFAVFYADDVDMSMSADEAARKKAIEYRRKWQMINCSFESGEDSNRSTSLDRVDMIG